MKGLGIDTLAMTKFRTILLASGDSFVEHVYTEEERSYCRSASNPDQSFAGHFAAKEALLKAIPDLRSYGVDFSDIEITHDAFGKPFFRVEGKLKQNMQRVAANALHLSISHSGDTAVAVVALI